MAESATIRAKNRPNNGMPTIENDTHTTLAAVTERYIYLSVTTANKETPPPWYRNTREYFSSRLDHIFTKTALSEILGAERQALGIPNSVGTETFIARLVAQGLLEELQFTHDAAPKSKRPVYAPFTRYLTGNINQYEMALSLRSNSYISHASALWIHQLLDRAPTAIYLNREQTPKARPPGPLTQPAIDRAFNNPARESKYIFAAVGLRFVLVSGKNTNHAGVTSLKVPEGTTVPITTVERTLIDSVVRPIYAGGVRAVMTAFRRARTHVSVDRLLALLSILDHMYPYHQSIGFYMERAGFETAELDMLRTREMKFDFYLANKMNRVSFDRDWRIHYPSDLDTVVT